MFSHGLPGRMEIFMKNFLTKTLSLLLVCVLFVCVLSGCKSAGTSFPLSEDPYSDHTEIIYDLDRSTISVGKYLYFVAYYEMIGQNLFDYYKSSMGYDGNYWNEMYDETRSESQYYKDMVEETVLFYEIFKNAALDAGYTLSEDELAAVHSDAEETYKLFTEDQIKKSGLTIDGIDAALRTMQLSLKYTDMIRKTSSEKDEFKAITEESKAEEYLQNAVNMIYEEFKKQYQIVANADLLETFELGKVTLID